jgi:hypothetical protein
MGQGTGDRGKHKEQLEGGPVWSYIRLSGSNALLSWRSGVRFVGSGSGSGSYGSLPRRCKSFSGKTGLTWLEICVTHILVCCQPFIVFGGEDRGQFCSWEWMMQYRVSSNHVVRWVVRRAMIAAMWFRYYLGMKDYMSYKHRLL